MSKLMKLLKSKAVRQGIKEAQKHVVPFVKKELAKRKGTKKKIMGCLATNYEHYANNENHLMS